MEPTKELIDSIEKERILRARRTSPQQKLSDGPELFDLGCRIMMDGLRHENPGASEEELRKLLKARLELLKRLEDSQ